MVTTTVDGVAPVAPTVTVPAPEFGYANVHSAYWGNVAETHSKLTSWLNPTSGIRVRVAVTAVPAGVLTVDGVAVISILGLITWKAGIVKLSLKKFLSPLYCAVIL
jgi:hypothetical protein